MARRQLLLDQNQGFFQLGDDLSRVQRWKWNFMTLKMQVLCAASVRQIYSRSIYFQLYIFIVLIWEGLGKNAARSCQHEKSSSFHFSNSSNFKKTLTLRADRRTQWVASRIKSAPLFFVPRIRIVLFSANEPKKISLPI